MILAVVGLQREARILGSGAHVTLIGGGNSAGLKAQLDQHLAQKNFAGVLSIGIAGGLSSNMHPGSAVLATHIVHGADTYLCDPAWREQILFQVPRLRSGVIAGSDQILASRPEKTALYERTGAFAVDMESHIAARAAAEHALPFAALRVVCDPCDRTLPPAARVAMRADGSINISAVLRSLALHPLQIADLLLAARDSATAFRTLLRCRNRLSDGLGAGLLGTNLS